MVNIVEKMSYQSEGKAICQDKGKEKKNEVVDQGKK
jgi:hypothetical protein